MSISIVKLLTSKNQEFAMSTKSAFTGDDYTLQEIADKLGLTRERVRQIEMSALKKLKHPKLRAQWGNIIDSVRDMNDSSQKGFA